MDLFSGKSFVEFYCGSEDQKTKKRICAMTGITYHLQSRFSSFSHARTRKPEDPVLRLPSFLGTLSQWPLGSESRQETERIAFGKKREKRWKKIEREERGRGKVNIAYLRYSTVSTTLCFALHD